MGSFTAISGQRLLWSSSFHRANCEAKHTTFEEKVRNLAAQKIDEFDTTITELKEQ